MDEAYLMLTVAILIEALSGNKPEASTQPISLAVIDSRQAVSGALFVAIQGQRVDGHDFVQDAFNRGAVVAIIQHEIETTHPVVDLREPDPDRIRVPSQMPVCLLVPDSVLALQQAARFWRNRLSPRVIGITGSVGKSTTKEVAAEVLGQRYKTLRNQGNLNNEIGLPLSILGLDKTHQHAVLEMGFYVPGEIALLCELARPHVGVVTNIGTVHAERAGSQETIAKGKAELVQSLPEDGVAILNRDDPWVRWMASQTRAQVFFYGLTPEADLWADHVEGLGLEGIRFQLHYKKDVLHLRVPMIGRHSVQTALRASAIGIVEGLSWQEIVNGLRSKNTQLRLVAVRSKQGALLLDDTYNASPESTLAALNLLSELEGHKIAVLGDMLELGQYERQGHEMVGLRAAAVADELVTVGELARTIANTAHSAGLSSRKIVEVETNEDAINYLNERLTAKDVVLIKGSRSLEMDKIVESLETQA
jgi:UDP-N-acetylmuramoyl-tripeptide--D-alanyl-D-alanine ligase